MDIDEEKETVSYVSICEQASGSVRADKYLTIVFPDLNRTQIKKALDSNAVFVGDQTITKKYKFKEGEEVRIELPPERSLIPHAVSIPLKVIFEDDDIVVVDKPAGMVTHPGNATGDDTLVHALLAHCNDKLSRINGEDRPGIVHRLDKDTSGVIIAAKTDEACSKLLSFFKERELVKEYLALVSGCPNLQSGVMEGPIGRHSTHRTRMAVTEDGREARTDWELLKSNGKVSYLKCRIHTGRTHQIRVHLSDFGHPIIGDTFYGYRGNHHRDVGLSVSHPLLHAWRLVLPHPISGEEMEFVADVPAEFEPWVDYIA